LGCRSRVAPQTAQSFGFLGITGISVTHYIIDASVCRQLSGREMERRVGREGTGGAR
jgi:hypothetical protein